jgi:PDZ domain
MPKTKVPWWMYVVASSYAAYLCIAVYLAFWGPEWVGVRAIQDRDRVTVEAVSNNSPASRGGLRAGDQILACAGHNIRSVADWYAIVFNIKAFDNLRIDFVREGERLERTLVVPPRTWRSSDAIGAYGFLFMQIAYLAIAFVIAFARPFNLHARLGALFLASAVTLMVGANGLGVVFRELPGPVQALLWVQGALGRFGMAAFCAFFATFPKPLFRGRWAWALYLAPIITLAPLEFLYIWSSVYFPNQPTGAPAWMIPVTRIFWLTYVPAALITLLLNYQRLNDATERRRVRILVLGIAVIVFVTVPLTFAPFVPPRSPALKYSLAVVSGLALPASFAYAILRHRLFDIRVIIRQGLQYAIARNALLFVSPALLTMFVADVLLRGGEPLGLIMRERGSIYISLAESNGFAHSIGDSSGSNTTHSRSSARLCTNYVLVEAWKTSHRASSLRSSLRCTPLAPAFFVCTQGSLLIACLLRPRCRPLLSPPVHDCVGFCKQSENPWRSEIRGILYEATCRTVKLNFCATRTWNGCFLCLHRRRHALHFLVWARNGLDSHTLVKISSFFNPSPTVLVSCYRALSPARRKRVALNVRRADVAMTPAR